MVREWCHPDQGGLDLNKRHVCGLVNERDAGVYMVTASTELPQHGVGVAEISRFAHQGAVDFNHRIAAQHQVIRMPVCNGECLVERKLFCLVAGRQVGRADFFSRGRHDLERDAEQGQ